MNAERISDASVSGKVWTQTDFVENGMPIAFFKGMMREFAQQSLTGNDILQYGNISVPRTARVQLTKQKFGIDAQYAPAIMAAYESKKKDETPKPDDAWERKDFIKYGVPKNLLDHLIRTLKIAKEANQDAEYRGKIVPKEDIFLFNAATRGKSEFCVAVAADQAKELAEHAIKTENIPSYLMTDGVFAQGMGFDATRSNSIFREIRNGLEQSKEKAIEYWGVELPQGVIEPYYNKGQLAYGISRPFGHALREEHLNAKKRLEEELSGYWTTTEFAAAAGIGLVEAGQYLETVHEKAQKLQGEAYENKGIKFTANDFKILTNSKQGTRIALKAEKAQAYAEKIHAEKENAKPEGVLSYTDLYDLGISTGKYIADTIKAQFDLGREKASYRAKSFNLEFPNNALVTYYQSGREAVGFTREHGERIISAYIASGKKVSLDALETKGITPPSAQPLSKVLEKAERFVREAVEHNPPHTLFCAFLDPDAGRNTPIELRMYRWGDNPNGEGIIIHRPPLQISIKTGCSLAYGAALLSEGEDRILAMPGVQAYRKLNNRHVQFAGGDEIIPNAAPINGNGLGVIEEKKGTFHLRLQYGEPDPADISINLGIVHTPENREAAELRAEAARQHIQELHQRGAVATKLGVTDWLSAHFPFQSPYSNENIRRVPVDFPTPGASNIVIYPPHFEGTPSSMWKARVGFEWNGKPITGTNASRILSFHMLEGDATLERLRNSAHIIKRILEAQAAGGGQWALDAQGQILQRQDNPNRPHDVDAVRLRDICNLAARYELEHEVVEARPRMQIEQNDKEYLSVTLGLRRTHRGQLTEECFSERLASNAPAEALERTVYIPVRGGDREAANERAGDFVQRVRELADSYLRRDYANFNPLEMRLRRPKPYQPASFRNMLETAIDTAISDEFRNFRTDLPPSPDRENGDMGPRLPFRGNGGGVGR